MTIPTTVRDFLRETGGQYKARAVPVVDNLTAAARAAKLPAGRVAQVTLVASGPAIVAVIHPAGHEPDFKALERLFERPFGPCDPKEVERLFPDCDPRALPPLPSAYGVKAVIDSRLGVLDDVYFAPGCTGMLVRATREEFAQLTHGAWMRPVARPVAEVINIAAAPAEAPSAEQMRERVKQLHQLPAMPGMALQIMQIRNNPYSHVSELAAVVEQDPSLSAQIMRYAASPFFGYQGKVDSVAMAIARVLGMDFVMDLAFGLALGKPFRNPAQGPLGLNAFWQHATYTAALTQSLCQRIPYMRRPSPGLAYLSGLLHNFGLLLLGHLFPDQFKRLNKAVLENPDRPLIDLEREVLGLTHCDLGLWLMEEWGMPREIIESVREHHNAAFRGDYAVYSNLVYIANVLLKRHGIGEADTMIMPAGLLESVGLDEVEAEAALGMVLESRESLEFIAKKMAA